jgi:hypothetical protein
LSKSIAGGAQTTALTITDGVTTSSDARNLIIELTGTITGNQIVTVPDGIEKSYIFKNNTLGAFTVQVKTVSGSGFTFSTTDKGTRLGYTDGTNLIDVNAAFTTISQFSLPASDGTNGQALTTDGSANLSFADVGISTGKAIVLSMIFG